MKEYDDIDFNLTKIWYQCRKCDNYYPSMPDGPPPTCDHCGNDRWAPYRPCIRDNPFGVLDVNWISRRTRARGIGPPLVTHVYNPLFT